jgi:hypothetical protein
MYVFWNGQNVFGSKILVGNGNMWNTLQYWHRLASLIVIYLHSPIRLIIFVCYVYALVLFIQDYVSVLVTFRPCVCVCVCVCVYTNNPKYWKISNIGPPTLLFSLFIRGSAVLYEVATESFGVSVCVMLSVFSGNQNSSVIFLAYPQPRSRFSKFRQHDSVGSKFLAVTSLHSVRTHNEIQLSDAICTLNNTFYTLFRLSECMYIHMYLQ